MANGGFNVWKRREYARSSFLFLRIVNFSRSAAFERIQIAESVQVEFFHKVLLKERLSLQLRSAAITYAVLLCKEHILCGHRFANWQNSM